MSNSPEEAKASSLLQLPLRIRGQHSKNFKNVKVISNHYFLNMKEKIDKIAIFSVRFTPFIPNDNSKLRRELLEKIKPSLKIKNPVISGKNIFSLQDVEQLKQIQVEEQGYSITIVKVKVLDIKERPTFLLGFLNNALRGYMRNMNYVEIGRTGKYFNAKEKTNIDGLVMYNGYKSNFVQLEKGIYLRVDSAKKIVRNQTVLDYVDQIYKLHQNADKEERRNILKGNLIGQIVMANYGRTDYHKIADIKFQQMATIEISKGEKGQEKMNMIQYYLKRYGITIKKPKQPLLVVQSRKKGQTILLVPELMLMTGIPQNFDEFRRKKISQNTIRPPNEKHKQIQRLMDKLSKVQELRLLQQMGIDMCKKMEKVNAKLVSNPVIELGQKNSVEKGKEAFFNLFNKPIFSAKHKVDMGIIFFKGSNLDFMLKTFQSTASNLRVDLKFQLYQISSRPNVGSVQKELERVCEKQHNMGLIVIPNNMKNDYNKLKCKAVDRELLTQVMTEAQMNKKNFQSIATKILLQILAKRGNTLWVPKPICHLEGTMLVGFDSCKLGKASLLAICATINSTFSSVFSKKKVFQNPSDKFGGMSQLLLEACKAYVNRNNCCPKQVIVFTNTCPGDQVKLYHEFFINPILGRYAQIYEQQTLKIQVVMINVKTSERFFIESGDHIINVNAGTIVSQDLVSINYDFYLTSQQSNKGTSVPNHYRVIFSNTKTEEGVLHELIFSQCFNYINWTGSIKVPAILQYAKKCAKFNSEVLENKQVPESLNTKLYFV